MATDYYNFNLPSVGGDADDWGTLLNTNWQSLDGILNGTGTHINIDSYTADGMTITNVASASFSGDISEAVHDAGTDGTIELDASNGTIQTIEMTGPVDITSLLQSGQYITLRITSVGSDTVTWPQTMQWMFGIEPDLHSTATNWIGIWNVGGTLYGSYTGYTS
jgi:hypothetical protein